MSYYNSNMGTDQFELFQKTLSDISKEFPDMKFGAMDCGSGKKEAREFCIHSGVVRVRHRSIRACFVTPTSLFVRNACRRSRTSRVKRWGMATLIFMGTRSLK